MTKTPEDLFAELFEAPFVHIDLGPGAGDYEAAAADGTTPTIWTEYGKPDTFLQGGAVGWLPLIFRAGDQRSAKEQIEARYQHGGGYRLAPEKLEWQPDGWLHYPGDPPRRPIAETTLDSGEHLTIYDGSWLLIRSADNATYAIVGMD